MPFANYIRRPLVFNELGKPINDLSVEEALNAAGLNFNVGIMEARVRLESLTEPGKFYLHKIPNTYATYRTDNNYVFGSVGGKYEIVQNSVALDFIEAVCNYDKTLRIETAGCYRNGASMLVTAKFPDSMKIGTNDDIDRYLLFTNSHDGSGMINCAVTNIRVICNNMLNQAIKSAFQSFSFKHTKSVKDNIRYAVEQIKFTYGYTHTMIVQMDALRKVKVDDKFINNFVYDLFLDANQKEHLKLKPNILAADNDIVSTRLKNKVVSILDTIQSGVGQNLHRGSALWLYNGVNCYVNNVIDYKSEEDRFEALTKKTSAKLNQKAYDSILTSLAA